MLIDQPQKAPVMSLTSATCQNPVGPPMPTGKPVGMRTATVVYSVEPAVTQYPLHVDVPLAMSPRGDVSPEYGKSLFEIEKAATVWALPAGSAVGNTCAVDVVQLGF